MTEAITFKGSTHKADHPLSVLSVSIIGLISAVDKGSKTVRISRLPNIVRAKKEISRTATKYKFTLAYFLVLTQEEEEAQI